MGSVSQTPEMMVTKISFVILGLILIGSSYGGSYHGFVPELNDIYFPTLGTTFKGFGNVDEPTMNFKAPGTSKNMDENLLKSLVEIFPSRRFFVKRAAPDQDPNFDHFSATRG